MTLPSLPLCILLLSSGLALAALTGTADIAWADEPAPAALEPPPLQPPPPTAPQLEHFEYWRSRADAASERLAQAEAELRAAEAAVSRMRRRNHPRGEARVQIREERDAAREAYQAARRALEVELPEEAQRAGVPRHWVSSKR